jgi:hypothetical protein
VQVDSGDLPEKAKSDEQPQTPAQKNELQDGNAYEHVPETSGREIPTLAWHSVPGRRVKSDPAVPDPQTYGIDKQ